MSVDPKVIAAITSAVDLYMKAEQESIQAAQAAQPPQPSVSVCGNQYALAGRQAAMNARWAWQMRLPK
jgi:hypothetical protein